MFTETAPYFSAKISCGDALGLFLLSPANSNSRGNKFTRRPGNESEEALSNGESLQGADFVSIGKAAERVLRAVKERAGEQSREGGPPPLASNEAQQVQGGLPARRSNF